jgi:hypothetical protein
MLHWRVESAAGFNEVNRHLSALELLLNSDGLPTQALLLCDAGFAVTFEWLVSLERALDAKFDWSNRVVTYRERLKSYPAVSDELDYYRPAIRAYLYPDK